MKNKKIFLGCMIGIAVFMVLFFGVLLLKSRGSSGNSSAGPKDGYITIDSIPGVTFEVSGNLADYATAVTEVSDNVDFIKNATYSFRNGIDTYMLFNMSQYIVVAYKGTTFDFQNNGVSA